METKFSNRSIVRILDIINILTERPNGLQMMEIVQLLDGAPKSSVYNLLQQLLKYRYVAYNPKTKKYKIGPSLIKISSIILTKHTIKNQARPFMVELSNRTFEDVYLGIEDGDRLLYIDKVEGSESIRLNISIGARRYFHNTAIGKILMANFTHDKQMEIVNSTQLPVLSKNTIGNYEDLKKEFKKIKDNDYSISNEESLEGVLGIGAPIRDAENKIIAGICISGPKSRVNQKRELLIALVKETARNISEQLGAEIY